eukprot:bmy_12613T0
MKAQRERLQIPGLTLDIELGSQILHSTRDNVSQLGGMEWLQCLCVPILGPEGTDKTTEPKSEELTREMNERL